MTHTLLSVNEDCVTFEERYDFNDESEALISRSTLRFPDLESIEKLAKKNGLIVSEAFGNWQREPFTPDSPEIIVQLRKAA